MPARLRRILDAWNRARDAAALQRGVLVAAPVFWASFAVFLHPVAGAAGFALHALACLPRRLPAALLLLVSGPALALLAAAREPALSLPGIPFHAPAPEDEAPMERTGRVMNFPSPNARGFSFLFRSDAPPARLYRVALESSVAPEWGARIRLRGRARHPEPPPNPGQLDMRRVLRSQGAEAMLEVKADAPWTTLEPPPAWKRALIRARAELGAAFVRRVPLEGRPLLEAALLNDVGNVPEETRAAFLRSGMQHILAISGQHIGLLIAFLLAAGACFRLPRKLAFAIAGALTAVYIPLTGAPVSVVRSGIMLACVLPGVMLERPTAALHALCLTAAIDLLVDPFNLLNLGFQLSYGATLALILCSRPGAELARRLPGTARSALLSAMAQMFFLSVMVTLFTWPALAASTHATAPWGIPGNLVTVPVSSVMLVAGLCVWTFDFLLPAPLDTLADWTGAVAGLSAIALEGCVHFLANLPGALRPIAHASTAWLTMLALASAAIVLSLRAGRFLLAGLGLAALLAAELPRPWLSRPGPGEARVTFLAVGHGDAAVLELPGATLLIDAGDSPRVAEQIILPFLRYRGIARLDALMITHPDRDHFGGAEALLRGAPVGFVLGPPEPREPGTSWACLRETARRRGVAWREGREGQRVYESPGVSLRLLGPGGALADADKNDRSLVAWLRTPRATALFTGDIEAPGQRALRGSWPLWRGAWLKAPHHGSDRTTLPCFAAGVEAPRAAISCGGRKGFPGPTTVDAFVRAGTRVQTTADAGAVVWEFSSGEGLFQRLRRVPGAILRAAGTFFKRLKQSNIF